ncbi:Ig-like domain-containing protein [Staphylococcus gallinarum]|uniref:Ig-like domain-containing protein n=1 Tax=Staphylococcus gallinarum TaxID=1293 RepID=UPI001E50708D|nr:Ig-like domain-containing protein [Staphylococcus gallinarum]MCD8870831.1 YSIRK-type signal peptide-containing protein [Staphylococcus gallinarum]
MNKNCNNISSQRNKYSIRKLTVGTASLLIGATLVFGLGNEAYADELASQEKKHTVANSNENSEPHEQQESTTVDKSQEQSVQQSTQEQTAHETKHIDEAQQSTNETTSQSTASQHEHINKDVTNEHESNEEQQNKEESIETQTEPINNKEESVLTEHKPEETKQQITEAEASTEESETSSLQAPKNSNVNNSINKPQIIRPEEQKNENTKESRKVNGQAQPDKQTQNKKLKKVVATHEASTRSLKRTKRQTTANRDKTEDASLETLDYSDNYTFQTLIFDPEKLIDNNILKGKRIPFKIHSYMIGANSGERYKINLQLDEVIANHITKVSAIPANQSMPVEFTRLENAIGKKTNIWQVNYIRANNGLFGGAEILSQYTAEGGVIELDDTVENILNSQTDLFEDKLNYLIYVKDAQENKKIKTSETSGYFLTKAEESYTNLKKSTSDAANNAFKASCGSVQFDASIGEYGAFVGDQQILKNGILNYGGPLLDSGLNKQWTYHYKIDPKLLPFAGQIELHRYDFKGLSGFDKTYYEDTRVAILPVNANGEGSITSYDLNSIIEFNNSLPETVGIRIVVKFNQTPNNILIRDAKFDDNGNLIADTSKIKEEFTFYGYLTDRFGGLIKNTFGTSTYYIQDIDRDGLTDNFEIHSSHTDPFNSDTDNDGNTDGNEFMNLRTSPLVAKPVVQDVSTDMDVIKGTVRVLDGATEQEVKIMDSQNKEIGKGKLETNGDFSIKVSNLKPGQYTANIISSKYKNPEKSTFNALDITEMLKPVIEEVNETDLDIGVTGIEGSTITVKDNKGKFIGRVNIAKGQSGAFIKLKQPLKVGTVLIATAKKGRNTSVPSDPVTVIDSASIDAPIVNPVSNRDSSVTGTTEPNAIIRVVLPNDMEILSKGDENGRFEVLLPDDYKLKVGDKIEVIAISGKGISSEPASVTVQGYIGFPIVQPVTTKSKVITGLAASGSLISVKLPDGSILYGKAADSGDFEILLPSHIKYTGGERLELSAISQPGNFALSTPIIVQDMTPPEVPIVNEVNSESSQITGTAEAGSTVKVELPDGSEVIDVTNYQGEFIIDLPANQKFRGGEQLKVTSTDASGNKSTAAIVDVKDITPPVVPTVSEVTSESPQVSGTAEAGSTVKVELPDGTELTGVADDQGNYGIDIPANQKFRGGEQLKVTSTDPSGNKSDEKVIDVKDTTPPVAPTVSEVTSESPQISGTAEAGSTVKVELPDGTELTGVADDQGNYGIDIPANKKFNGGESIKITSTDASGNKSDEKVIDVKDTTPPVAPTVSEVTSESTQVTGTGEPGSTVKVELPDGTELTGVADDQGNYGIDIPANKKFRGGEQLKVTSTDPSGNKSDEKVIDVKDTTPPVAPTVSEVTSESPQISGTAEAGSTVKVELPDGTELTGVADDQGNYGIDIPANQKFRGGEQLKVTSTDPSGNKSDEKVIDVKDTTPPVAPTVSEVTSESTQITGTGEPGSTVKVELPDGTELTGVADDQGNYTIDLPSNKKFNGGESIKITSTDASGNKSDEKVIGVKDTTPPVAPTVSEVTSESTQVTGTGEPGSTVKVELPDGTELTGVADDQGNYGIDIPSNKKFRGGEQLKVTSTDPSGNKSNGAVVEVKDTTPPFAPLVFIVSSEDTQISGESEPGSIIKVELPDGTELTGVADDQGNYGIDIPANKKFRGGEQLKVTSTDPSGNKSKEIPVKVRDVTPPNAPTVNEVTSKHSQITGTAEVESEVNIELPDGTKLKGVTDDRGNYSIDIPNGKEFRGGEQLKVTSTDISGNESQITNIIVKDTTPPFAPLVEIVTSEGNQIRGASESGSIVKVELPDGTKLTGVANTIEKFVIDIPSDKKLQGGDILKVTATDQEGNKSLVTTINVIDTTPPKAPSVLPLTSENVEISVVGEPGSTIKILLPDNTELIGQADNQGVSVIALPGNKKFQGGERLRVTSTDATGNESLETVVEIIDVTPPKAPSVNPVTSESLQITGTTEPNTSVKVIMPDSTELVTIANDRGEFTIDLTVSKKLQGGENLKIKSIDTAGNVSHETIVEVKDTTPPLTPIVNPINSESTNIVGRAEPKTTVKVELPDGTNLMAKVDSNGNYTIDIPRINKFQGGENIKVSSIDDAGNKSQAITINVKDATPPTIPTIDEVTSESTQVSGTSEPGSTIKLVLPDGTELSNVTDDRGNYVIDLTNVLFNGGEELNVTSTDITGNRSEILKLTVKDVTAPEAPSVNPVTSENMSVTGISEPGSIVKVVLPNGSELTGVANNQGEYTIDLSQIKLTANDKLKVTATDAVGNKSEVTTIEYKDITPPITPKVNQITSESTQITGSGEPNTAVKLKLPNGLDLIAIINDQGNFTINLPSDYKLQGNEKVIVFGIDESLNISEEKIIDVRDITPPKAPQVYPIASSSFSLSGMSEPETQIIVKLPNGKLIYGEADKQGIYSVKVLDEYVFQGGETIEVTATDKAGNMSKPTTIVVDDDTPPSPPVIYEVTSDSKSISGKTEPFATIKVAVSYKDLIVGKANKKGEFNLPIPKDYNLDGGEEMRITSTDISGNVSDKTYIIVKDVTAPKPPSVLPITSESEEIIGKTEPNAIITVKISNGNKLTENADNFGNYVISIPKNFKLNGGEKIQLSATDPSGNVSDVSEIIVADITPPTVPTAKPLTSKDLQIIGTGEPQSTIRVELPNGTQLLGKVDNNGKYVIDLPNKVIFNGGENIKIVSTDKAGNMSLPLILMVKDTTPPVMPKIDSFTTESKQLTGITEPDAVVNAQLPTGEKLSVKADNKGAFVIDLPSGLVFKGGEKLSITAVDAQGNETSPIIIIVKDTTIPETPKVNKVTSESTHITGTAEPGAIVKVKLPNGKLLTAQVDKQGTFNVKLPSKGTFKGGEVLEVSVVDPSSNESLATTIHVEDITAPKSPTVKPITSDNPLVVGTAEVGSTIKVKLPNGKVISTKVDKQGNYKVKIPNNFKLNGGESLIITATDVSGNTSEEITVKVTDNTAPTNPNVNPIDKDSKNISGTAEANATIKIKLPNGKVLGGNADSKGRFDIKVPETVDLSKMKSIKVIAIDANGNTSNEVNVDIEQTNHTQDVIHNNGTVNDQQSNMSHSQALEHVQSGIEQGLNGQHDADKSMNSDHENEASGSNHEQGELPSTGQNDAVNTTAYGSLMALIGSSLLFTRRRKSNDKNKQDN